VKKQKYGVDVAGPEIAIIHGNSGVDGLANECKLNLGSVAGDMKTSKSILDLEFVPS
jgi:hypothetical protein